MIEKKPMPYLSVGVLKKVLELLPEDFEVVFQIDYHMFSVQTFDIWDDEGELILKWFDMDYSDNDKPMSVEEMNYRMYKLEEENRELKEELKEHGVDVE